MLAASDWLRVRTLPGLCQVLRHLKVHWKRARAHVHSPDLDYVAKLASIRLQLRGMEINREQLAFVFQDEFTFYRQPGLAYAYEAAGHYQPIAELGWKSNYAWRIAATLDAWTGRVIYAHAKCFDRSHLVAFYQKLVTAYPLATSIAMAQDNWPVHFHPDVQAALQPQSWEWPLHLPANWSTQPGPQAKHLDLPIRIHMLPTYASWTNPIEKLWRLLKQEVLHLHRFGDDWLALKAAVINFLDQFASGSQDLLRYVGLSDPTHIYRSLFSTAMPELRY